MKNWAGIFLLAVTFHVSAVQLPYAQTPDKQGIEQRTNHGVAQPPGAARVKLPDGVSLDGGLAEDAAVAIALWNNAAFHADLAALGIARADLVQADLLKNPVFSILLPLGYRQLEAAVNFPVEVLWQRPRRVAAAKIEVQRVAQSLEQNALNLVRDVKVAYSDWILAKDRARLAEEAVQLRRRILRLTEVRLRVGDISELEAYAARNDATLAEEQAARLKHEVTLARDRLRFLMGIEGEQIPFDLTPTDTDNAPVTPLPVAFHASPMPTLEPLFQTAFEARPDLRAAEIAVLVAAQRAKWERSRILTLAGLFNFKHGAGLGPSPRPGVLAELPLFNRNQGGLARADAEVERAARQYLVVRHRISLEVQEARTQVSQAREALEIWRGRVRPQAEENVRMAERSFSGCAPIT